MKILGLATTIYQVSDVDAAKAWYTKWLGIAPYFDQPFHVGFNVAGYELGLQPDAPASAKVANVVAYWRVPNAREAFQQMLEFGAVEEAAPTEVGEGIVVASVRDPWGNVVGLIENPHFSV